MNVAKYKKGVMDGKSKAGKVKDIDKALERILAAAGITMWWIF